MNTPPLIATAKNNDTARLVEDNMGLVRAVVARFLRKGSCPMEDSDLYSAGCVGLVKAANTFDPGVSKFSTWATRIISQHVISELRRLKSSKIVSMDGSEALLPDTRRHGEFPQVLFERLVMSNDSDTKSDSDTKRLLREFFVEGRSLSDLGSEMGVTKQTVKNKVDRALAYVRSKNAEIIRSYS